MTVLRRLVTRVLIGGEPEDVYLDGDEIVISGHMRIYADEAVGLAAALIEVATQYAMRKLVDTPPYCHRCGAPHDGKCLRGDDQ
jgi:hypothetical protein